MGQGAYIARELRKLREPTVYVLGEDIQMSTEDVSPDSDAAFVKIGSVVHMRGAVDLDSAAGSLISELPAELTPVTRTYTIVHVRNIEGGQSKRRLGYVYVEPYGVVIASVINADGSLGDVSADGTVELSGSYVLA